VLLRSCRGRAPLLATWSASLSFRFAVYGIHDMKEHGGLNRSDDLTTMWTMIKYEDVIMMMMMMVL
jgi:hypothetical protein